MKEQGNVIELESCVYNLFKLVLVLFLKIRSKKTLEKAKTEP